VVAKKDDVKPAAEEPKKTEHKPDESAKVEAAVVTQDATPAAAHKTEEVQKPAPAESSSSESDED